MNIKEKYNLELKPGIDFNIEENHWLPNKMGADFFVFGKTMYCKNTMKALPRHEFLHVAQFRKYGSFLVVLHYLFYLTLNGIKFRDFGKAFKAVPFEIEARKFEENQE